MLHVVVDRMMKGILSSEDRKNGERMTTGEEVESVVGGSNKGWDYQQSYAQLAAETDVAVVVQHTTLVSRDRL